MKWKLQIFILYVFQPSLLSDKCQSALKWRKEEEKGHLGISGQKSQSNKKYKRYLSKLDCERCFQT